MYKNLRDTWRGWRKNAYLGSRGGLAFVILLLVGLPMVAVIPFLLPLLNWTRGKNRRSGVSAFEVNAASFLEIGAALGYRSWMDKQLDVPWYYALTHPLA